MFFPIQLRCCYLFREILVFGWFRFSFLGGAGFRFGSVIFGCACASIAANCIGILTTGICFGRRGTRTRTRTSLSLSLFFSKSQGQGYPCPCQKKDKDNDVLVLVLSQGQQGQGSFWPSNLFKYLYYY